jgi:hypothetical protein
MQRRYAMGLLTSKDAAGSKMAKSASNPSRIAPLLSARPACFEVLTLVHSTTFAREIPRFLPSVHNRLRPNPSVLIPPQAFIKSPLSRHFRLATQGEWSDTTKSSVPSCSASQSLSRLSLSRTGGQHLNSGCPTGTSSSERQR